MSKEEKLIPKDWADQVEEESKDSPRKDADIQEKDFIEEIDGWRREVVTTKKWQELEPRRVRGVEACAGEYNKLSFKPSALITGVLPASWVEDSKFYHSRWLEGTLEGRVCLVPEICVEYMP